MMRFAGVGAMRRALWFGLATGLVLGPAEPASAQMQEGTPPSRRAKPKNVTFYATRERL